MDCGLFGFIICILLSFMLSRILCQEVPDPVAFFPLNAAYGTKEINNRATPGIPSGVYLSTGPYGQAGGAYEFLGTSNSFIEFPNTAGGPLDVRYSLTLLCWLYYDGQDGPIFNYRTGGAWGVHVWVVDGKFFARFNRRDYFIPRPLSHTRLAGGWKFVGASYDRASGEAKAWVDGVMVQTINIGAGLELATQDSVRMGARIAESRHFKGKIAQIQVYNVALTQVQIQAVRNNFVGSCRHLEFRATASFHGKRLTNHVIRSVDIVQKNFCGALCFMEHNCVSYNMEVTSGSTTTCELNNSTHSEHPEDLKTWNNYIYHGAKNLCAQLPCQNIATCQTGFTGKGYRCLCSPAFKGPHCENDIDECSASNECDINAVCNNTHGSYNCTCKEGYDGDGRTCTALPGFFPNKPGESCLSIRSIGGKRAVSGTYWLSGAGSTTYPTYCHVESAGQVWTLMARFSNYGAKNWMNDSGDWWYDKNVADGETADPSSNTDMISPAFWLVSGNELKITRSDDSQHTALLQTTGDCLGGQTFRSKITNYGDFRNGNTWRLDRRCLGNCTVRYGGQYETTKGFIRAKCNGTILSADKIGFWCDRGTWDGSVIMIGGSGTGACGNTYHGIGVTTSKIPSFFENSRFEQDFGDSAFMAGITKLYSLNLWIR